MTVSTTTNKVSYSGTGSQTVFAYTFKIFADGDLDVYIRDTNGTETLQTITTNYTVSGAGADAGGNVTFVTAPGSTDTVVIQRKLDLTQGTDYVANDPFPAESHEDALDRLTFITQQIQEEVDRSIKASVTNTISSTDFAISASDRANKIFAFDASGDLAVTQEIGTFRGNWAASTDYEQRDLVKDTSTNNIFIVNTAHTSSGAQPLTTNANSAKYDLIVDAASATTSATTATTQATAAATSATAAATSATNAATSESNASTSETNAATSATSAATSATNAGTSATAAAASETAAGASETAAAASETAAAASETAAAASETAAATSETNASTSASTATTKASEAATSATNAATSETNASTSATTATTKASEASTSATNAATSATAAAASQTAAAASAASAASAFDNFDDTYLGSKTSDPTTDNDGDPLTSGDLYFNSTANEMRVYDGANWIAATSAGNVSLILYEYTATAGQTTFSGSDDNSATLSYTVDNLQVVMNGVVLDPSDFTATNGTSVVLASGAALNDIVNIYAFKSFTTADMVSKTAGGTFSGNVTFAGSFTSQGIDDNATSTAMTLDTSGNVLVGKTSEDATTVGSTMRPNGGIVSVRDGDTNLVLNRKTSDGTIVDLRKDGTTFGQVTVKNGDLNIGNGITGLRINDGSDVIHPFSITGNSSTNNLTDLGTSTSTFKDLYLGGGAYIGGTGAANYLDDVEEGTFTATLNGSGGHPATRLTTTGYYQKVNNMVYINLNFNSVTTTSYSGQISVFGLPFTCGNGAARQAFTVGSYSMASFSSSTGSIFGHLSDGNTEIYILGIRSASSWEDVVHSAGASRFLQITGAYTAA